MVRYRLYRNPLHSFQYTLEPPAAFNIATSVYSALMKVTDELFLNYCYCCKFEAVGEEDEDEEYKPINYGSVE